MVFVMLYKIPTRSGARTSSNVLFDDAALSNLTVGAAGATAVRTRRTWYVSARSASRASSAI